MGLRIYTIHLRSDTEFSFRVSEDYNAESPFNMFNNCGRFFEFRDYDTKELCMVAIEDIEYVTIWDSNKYEKAKM